MSHPFSKKITKLALSIPIFLGIFTVSSFVNQNLKSASLSTVSITSSNPRPSFRGALTSGNSVGSTTVIINTTAGTYPSTSSAQLVEGDVLRIGAGPTLGSYTVASTSSNSTFTVTTGLASGNTTSGNDVVSTSSAALTVRFKTQNAIANGRFRILVPSLTAAAAAADGIPDGGAFDFATSAPTVTCPTDVSTTYDFVTGTATAASIIIGSQTYHSYECAYSGAGAVNTEFDGSPEAPIVISNIINPAPKSNHTLGTADSYNVVVQQLNSSLSVQDTTTVSIAVIEAVKITATVAPQITFQILGLATGTSACGVNTNVTTTPTAVPFGDISISSFTNAAQSMNVSTNATGGFTVTAIENDQLGRDGGACAGTPTVAGNPNCIPDALGNGGAMTESASAEWTNASITNGKGFGYSLHDVNNTTTEAFAYTTATGNCTGTFCARNFADAENAETAQQIFGSSTVADNQNLYVCYRIVAANITAAGNYENYITYNATATF